jgi:hypothetical protein
VAVAKKQTIEEIVIDKFKPYYGKTIEQLVDIFQLDFINKKSKQYFSLISKAILNKILEVPIDKKATNYLEEFDKAEIQIKRFSCIQRHLFTDENFCTELISAFEHFHFQKVKFVYLPKKVLRTTSKQMSSKTKCGMYMKVMQQWALV